MSKTLKEIAEELRNVNKKVQLIYAFNGTGKTRLSGEFKRLIAPNMDTDDEEGQAESTRTKILYYNAFTEDLFSWDNDLELDAAPRLKIQPNTFTEWVLRDQGQDQRMITTFQRYTDAKLTPRFDENFSEVRFSFQRGNEAPEKNIKISKGEESNFIWSLFYSLMEQVVDVLNVAEPDERETNQFDQLKYIFIDDPVSSLDENYLIQLAVDLAKLIKSSDYINGQGIRFIISTHNPLFYNVLFNELGLSKNKGKGCHMLIKHEDGTFDLNETNGDSNKSFSYHLYLKRTIEQAIEKNEIQRYHFMLLRNLYEKTANFLGYPQWSELLPGEHT